MTARLIGINHVAIEVGDIDEALEFYGRAFELTLRGRGRHMAFIDIGDQFIALEAARTQPPDAGRHIGIVVDDREEALRALVEAGAERVGGNDVRDPWGNRLQIVDYRDVQFTKAPWILDAMGLGDREKSERALEELRAKGLAPPSE
jgi:lactoylglutathione lyase